MPHNHPPRCCCTFSELEGIDTTPDKRCPSCIEHGDLAECISCHQLGDQPHTDYCQRENRDYPGQPGVRPDGRNLTQYDPTSNPPPQVDLVGALHSSIDAARQERRARVGEKHDAGPWCPKPVCAWHGSPDR